MSPAKACQYNAHVPRIVNELRRGVPGCWLEGRLPLWPILRFAAFGYGGVLAVRSWLYRNGWLSRRRLPTTVVSVGNLTLGGTGKTVVVADLAQRLRDRGFRVGIVSRGYRRRGSGTQIVSEGRGPLVTVDESGDESYLLAQNLPGVPIVVGADRYEAGRLALERFQCQYLLLDDAFQNLAVVKDLDILLINARDPWGAGALFPAGVLREPLPALGRADWIILTRAEGGEANGLTATIRRYNPRAPILRATYEPSELLIWGEPAPVPVERLVGRPCLAFAGIADPASFQTVAQASGATLLAFHSFPDHHPYSAEDLETLEARARTLGAEALLTTEKDAVRLPARQRLRTPLWILRIRLEIQEGETAWADLLRRLA